MRAIFNNTNIKTLIDKLIDILFANGLEYNVGLLELAFENNYIINDSYRNISELELFTLCHEYNISIGHYPNLSVIKNYDIYKSLTINNNDNNDNIDSICCHLIQSIENKKIVPDNIMYELAIKHDLTKLVEYLENECKIKPNVNALIYINDFKKRKEYVKKIKKQQ